MFDPLVDKHLNSNQPPPNAYWQSTTDYITTSTLTSDVKADAVIIGAGYTGLSCAIELAKAGVKKIVVIEANHIGWGCSGRNAGFVLPGSGRLGYKQLVERFGKQQARQLHEDFIAATELVDSRIKETGANVDQTEQGYLKLAHSNKWLDKLKSTADYLSEEFDYQVEFLSKQQLTENYVDHQKAAGAIRYKNGYGLNPLKLINAYFNLATSLGVEIYCHSSVNSIEQINNHHIVRTNSGSVTADKLVVATNGYTTSGLNSPLKNKILPVLTNVVVTRPLTQQELINSNFKTHQVMMDTRELKYYYRLLADNRLLFGGRGAISGKDANKSVYQQRLLDEIKTTFPALENVNIDYNWIGWIAVAMDQMPHIHQTSNNIYYATGYCGSGVSFAAYAGKQLAEIMVTDKNSSVLNSPLPTFPFAKFRRIGQAAFYQYGRLKDSIS